MMTTDEEAVILQTAAMHNPSKRSIEFSSNNNAQGVSLQPRQSSEEIEPSIIGNGNGGPDIVEYELQSFDQSDIQTQHPQTNNLVRNNNGG